MIKSHQNVALSKLKIHTNSFLLWDRRTGKSDVLYEYIIHLIKNKSDLDIVIFTKNHHSRGNFKIGFRKYLDKVKKNYILKITDNNLYLINNNQLIFMVDSVTTLSNLLRFKPDFVLYDDVDIKHENDILDLLTVTKTNNIPIIFTSTYIKLEFLRFIDFFCELYINLYPGNKNQMDYFNYKDKNMVDFDIKLNRLYKLDEIERMYVKN